PSLSSDCDCGGGEIEPVECEGDCEDTTCHLLNPDPNRENEFAVSGYSRVVDFQSPGSDRCWWGENHSPLQIDMYTNHCVKEIQVISYTPCGVGAGVRSAHYRVEIDDIPVTDFQCSILSRNQYLYP